MSEDECHILRNEVELGSLHAGCFDSGDACGWRWRIIVRARTDHALRPGVGEFTRADERSPAFDMRLVRFGPDGVDGGIEDFHIFVGAIG